MADHHYVPQWYQHRFLAPGETRLHYLNLRPIRHVNGRAVKMRDVERWGPRKCFCEPNLYAVDVPGRSRDLYETILFGEVDRLGALAVEEVASAASREPISHENFENFFQFLSAQTLRTPKGLAWLRRVIPQLAEARHLQVMRTLERFRNLRCLTWAEGFQDILYVDSDDIGFVMTDHPVTTFNKACHPDSQHCRYPLDPSAFWKGSQTIFPLDSRRCMILTHTEYAHKQSMRLALTRNRTNPRMFARTIIPTNEIEHREVSVQDVAVVNHILKSRAARYVAAARQEWLYPERIVPTKNWQELGNVLMPKEALWRNTGGTWATMNSGAVVKVDAFGRMPRTPEEQQQAEAEVAEMRASLDAALAKNAEQGEP